MKTDWEIFKELCREDKLFRAVVIFLIAVIFIAMALVIAFPRSFPYLIAGIVVGSILAGMARIP